MPLSFQIAISPITVTITPIEEGGGGSPVPLVSSDFKNGVYAINGVSAAVGDVWGEDPSNWGNFNPSEDVVAGQGFVSGWPTMKHPLVADVIGSGCVIVIEVRYDGSGNFCAAGWDIADYPNWSVEWVGGIDCDGASPPLLYFDGHDQSGSESSPGSWNGLAGLHKYAAVVSSAEIAASVDGSTIITMNPVDNEPTDFSLFVNGDPGVMVIEKIEFFSLSDYDASDLPTLSAT